MAGFGNAIQIAQKMIINDKQIASSPQHAGLTSSSQ